MSEALRADLQSVIRRFEDRRATTDLLVLGSAFGLVVLTWLLQGSSWWRTVGLGLLVVSLARTAVHLVRRRRFDPVWIDQRLATGHRVRTYVEHAGVERGGGAAGFSSWLEAELGARVKRDRGALGSTSLRERLDVWIASFVLAALVLLLLWLGRRLTGHDGFVPFVEVQVQPGVGVGLPVGSGAGPGQGAEEATPGAEQSEPSPDASDPQPDRKDSGGPEPGRESSDPEEPEPDDSDSGEDRGRDEAGGRGASSGQAPEPPPGPNDDRPFVDRPTIQEVVVPEFFGDGPSERTTGLAAGLDDRIVPESVEGERSDPGGDPTGRPDPDAQGAGAAAAVPGGVGTPPGGPEGADPGDREPDLDPKEFEPSAEWPLRARHVPESERDLVRRWFEKLAERNR